MRVRVSHVMGDGLIIDTVITWVDGREVHGMEPLIGLNIVAGITGSGKSVLGEAIWLGVAHSIANLGPRALRDLVHLVSRIANIRVYESSFEACFEGSEILHERFVDSTTCVKTRIKGNTSVTDIYVASRDASPRKVGELAREDIDALTYALAQVVSVPRLLRETLIASSKVGELVPESVEERSRHVPLFLSEIFRRAVLEGEECHMLVPIIPPMVVQYRDEILRPCYLDELGLSISEQLMSVELDDRLLYRYSTGELTRELLDAEVEILLKLNRVAREKQASLAPMLYMDDAFDGLSAALVDEVAEKMNSAGISVYASTHRLEAGERARRVLALTYGTALSEVVRRTLDFRAALVDIDSAVSRGYMDAAIDACKKIVGADCEQYVRS